MCLLIGAPGVGKTLLLKRLNACSNRGDYTNIAETPTTIPTVGTNLLAVMTTKKTEITVRELGGCMAPIWHNYYSNCHALMFVVDLSNRVQVSASCILLLQVLTASALANTAILLIFNKTDFVGRMSRRDTEELMRMQDVVRHASQRITIMEVSAQTGAGLRDVAQWVQDYAQPDTAT